MAAQIGFVILSHAQPALLQRLLPVLDRTYRNPAIVVHHDFDQCSLPADADTWSHDLQFVRPHVPTRWANISIVTAFISALEVLQRTRTPDWFVLLSASDYPVRQGSEVLRELTAGSADLYMDYQFLDRAPDVPEPPPVGPSYLGIDKETWRKMAYTERYFMEPNPFTERLRCSGGDFWITGNARVAAKLISAPTRFPDLFKYYSTSFCPDESLCHTILANDPDLQIVNHNKRYARWGPAAAHPDTLTLSHYPDIVASGCHFARKISLTESSELLATLDSVAVWA